MGSGCPPRGRAARRAAFGARRALGPILAAGLAVRVYVLHLSAPGPLSRAFDRVLEDPDVASCAVEPGLSRLRFLAAPKVGDALAESIYLEGGLAWCSRHDYRVVDHARFVRARNDRP